MNDYVENLIDDEGIELLCKVCGNHKKFTYVERNRVFIGSNSEYENDELVYDNYWTEELIKTEMIHCKKCGHIIWSR